MSSKAGPTAPVARAPTEDAVDGRERPARRVNLGVPAGILSLIALVIFGVLFVPVALSVWVMDLIYRTD